MTNTNLIRCRRSTLLPGRSSVPGDPALRPEPVCGTAESGLLAVVGPWSVCLRSGRRPAMEVYEHGELLDVVVESSLGDVRLRGARRGWAGRLGEGPVACAWGRWPPCGAPQPVHFLGGGLRRRAVDADTVRTAGRFWFASAAGQFRWAQLRPASSCAEHLAQGRTA